jgi:hypothetical protein
MEGKKTYDFEIKIFGLRSEDISDSKDFFLYREIKNKFEDSLYCRFNKGIGHLIMRKKNQDFAKLFSDETVNGAQEEAKEEAKPEAKEETKEEAKPEAKEGENKESTPESQGEVIAQFTLTVTKKDSEETKSLVVCVYELSELEKEQFWRNHGKHFDSLIKQQYGQSIKYKTDGKANFTNTNVFLAGVKFKTLSEVRNMFKKLLKSKQPGDKVDGLDSEMLKEILKFHPKNDEKMKDFVNFEVNFHPDYPETKCFLAVDKEGQKKDFSYVKCLKRLADDISKAK